MSIGRYALCLSAAIPVLAGCAAYGSGESTGSVPQTSASLRGTPNAKSSALLYVTDLGMGSLDAFSYPKGKARGTVPGLEAPHGMCVDSAGDVWVTNTGASTIVEYPHGGTTPIATLQDPGYSPVGCAVDPKTGALAVTNLTVAVGSGPGNLLVFRRAKGKPRVYSSSSLYFVYFCGYDDKGNLFVDGNTNHINTFEFAELPSGGKSLDNVTLDQQITMPGSVQWDGAHVAVEDRGVASAGSTIYEFSISGSAGTEVGTTPLGGSTEASTVWIEGSTVVGADASGKVMFWPYPAGGAATKSITGFGNPLGVTVSAAN